MPCEVIAPSLIPRRSGAHVKTDRLDARNLARLHRAGELTAVRVPSAAEEALRDLVRTREDLKSDRRIARQRLKSFLLRYGKRYPVPRGRWGVRYELWLQTLRFEEPAAQAAFDHLVGACSVRDAQLTAIERQIEEAALLRAARRARGAPARLPRHRHAVRAHRAHRDLRLCRFPSAGSYMAFTGLVPREHSSGAARHQGAITKAGNAHVRRVLVEAAWAYRHRPAVRGKLAVRQEGLPPELLAYSWKAQLRLHAIYRRLAARRGREQGGGRRRARALGLHLGGDDRAHGRRLTNEGAMRAGGVSRPERSSTDVMRRSSSTRVPSGRQAPVRP